MRFSLISALFFSTLSVAAAVQDNYGALVGAITTFQESSPESFELIILALGQQKELLNSVSTSSLKNITMFLPSDAAFFGLDISTLTQNDLYTYFQYHIVYNQPVKTGYVRTFLGDDVFFNSTSLTIMPATGVQVPILGSASIGTNVVIYFISSVLTPPKSLQNTAAEQGWTALESVLVAATNMKIPLSKSADKTFLVPDEASIAAYIAQTCTPDKWTPTFLTLVFQTLTISTARVYSSQLVSGAVLKSDSGLETTVVIQDGIVTFTSLGVTATVSKADVMIEKGVVHVLSGLQIPAVAGICIV